MQATIFHSLMCTLLPQSLVISTYMQPNNSAITEPPVNWCESKLQAMLQEELQLFLRKSKGEPNSLPAQFRTKIRNFNRQFIVFHRTANPIAYELACVTSFLIDTRSSSLTHTHRFSLSCATKSIPHKTSRVTEEVATLHNCTQNLQNICHFRNTLD